MTIKIFALKNKPELCRTFRHQEKLWVVTENQKFKGYVECMQLENGCSTERLTTRLFCTFELLEIAFKEWPDLVVYQEHELPDSNTANNHTLMDKCPGT